MGQRACKRRLHTDFEPATAEKTPDNSKEANCCCRLVRPVQIGQALLPKSKYDTREQQHAYLRLENAAAKGKASMAGRFASNKPGSSLSSNNLHA